GNTTALLLVKDGSFGNRRRRAAADEAEGDAAADQEQDRSCKPERGAREGERRPVENVFAVTVSQEGKDLVVAATGDDLLAHDHAQVAGDRRLRFVESLAPADNATQFRRDRAGTRFVRGVGQDLIRT